MMGDEEQQQRIGKYTILDRIGGGQQGWVYRARVDEHVSDELPVGKVVALKEMHPVFGAEDTVHKLESRTKALLRLNQPNLVRYLDLFVANPGSFSERHVLVMEHLEGTTLSKLLEDSPAGLDWDVVQSIFTQCLRGLVYACEQGIIHRDIKPSNIFLCKGGVVKLIDFDIARKESGTQTATTGAVHGTFDYMAPDFAPDFEPSSAFRGDRASDIFSLAVCLYQALTGKLPYGSAIESVGDFFRRWRRDSKPRLSLRHGIFWVLVDSKPMMEKALSIERNTRYTEFSDLLTDVCKVRARVVRHGDREYHPLAVVGQGGFGMVFKAKQKPGDEIVALKYLSSTEHVKRFVREARVLKEFAHPHMVRFIDFLQIRNPEQYYLVMEYLAGMPGSSLRDRLRRRRHGLPDNRAVGLPPQEAAQLFDAYLAALQYLHENSVIHRDIKPANLYAPAGAPEQAKIMDLGIARDEQGTQTVGRLPGTLEYMAPEFGRPDHGRGSTQTDIYSLGLCFYEALTGRPPLPRLPRADRDALAEFQRRCEADPGISYDYPVFVQYPDLRGAVSGMLAYEPADRFPSADEARAALAKALEQRELLEADAETVFLDLPATGADVAEPSTAPIGPGVLPSEFRPAPVEQAEPTSAAIESVESVPSATRAFVRRLFKPLAAAAALATTAAVAVVLVKILGGGSDWDADRSRTAVAMRELGTRQFSPLEPYVAQLGTALTDIRRGVADDAEYPLWHDWLEDADGFASEIPAFVSNQFVQSGEDIVVKQQWRNEWVSLASHVDAVGWASNNVYDALRQFMDTDLAMQNFRNRLADARRQLPDGLAVDDASGFASAEAVARVYVDYSTSPWPKTEELTRQQMGESRVILGQLVTNCVNSQVASVLAGADGKALKDLSRNLGMIVSNSPNLNRLFALDDLRKQVDDRYVLIDRDGAKADLMARLDAISTREDVVEAITRMDGFGRRFDLEENASDMIALRDALNRRLSVLATVLEDDAAAAFNRWDIDAGDAKRQELVDLLAAAGGVVEEETSRRLDGLRDVAARKVKEFSDEIGEVLATLNRIEGTAEATPVAATESLVTLSAGLDPKVREKTREPFSGTWLAVAKGLRAQIEARDPLDERESRLASVRSCLKAQRVRDALGEGVVEELDKALENQLNTVWLTVRNRAKFEGLELTSDLLKPVKIRKADTHISIDRAGVTATSLVFRVAGPEGLEPIPSSFSVPLTPGGVDVVSISDVKIKPVAVTVIGDQLTPPIRVESKDPDSRKWIPVRPDTRLSPDQYAVRFLRPDYVTQETTVTISVGASTAVPIARPAEASWAPSPALLSLRRLLGFQNDGDWAALRDGLAAPAPEFELAAHQKAYRDLVNWWKGEERKIDADVAALNGAARHLCEQPDAFLSAVERTLDGNEYKSDPKFAAALAALAEPFETCASQGLGRHPPETRQARLATWRTTLANDAAPYVLSENKREKLQAKATREWRTFLIVASNESQLPCTLTVGEKTTPIAQGAASEIAIPATSKELTVTATAAAGYTPATWRAVAENGGTFKLRIGGFEVRPIGVRIVSDGVDDPPVVTGIAPKGTDAFADIPAEGLEPGDYTVRFDRPDYVPQQTDLVLQLGSGDVKLAVPSAERWTPEPALKMLRELEAAVERKDEDAVLKLLERPATFEYDGHKKMSDRLISGFVGGFENVLKTEMARLRTAYSESLGYAYQISDPSVAPYTYRRDVEPSPTKTTSDIAVRPEIARKMGGTATAFQKLLAQIESGAMPEGEKARRDAYRFYDFGNVKVPDMAVKKLLEYQQGGGVLDAYDTQLVLVVVYRCWQIALRWYQDEETKTEDPAGWDATLKNFVERMVAVTDKANALLLGVDPAVAQKTVGMVRTRLRDRAAAQWLHGFLLRHVDAESATVAAARQEWQGQDVMSAVKAEMDDIAEMMRR